jgi:hypothetical protein
MKKRRPRIKMKRGIYILPNLFTTGNLFCGFWSIISVFDEKYFYAAVAILLAAVFDALDGKVAKLSGATRGSPCPACFQLGAQAIREIWLAGGLPLRGLRGVEIGQV